MSCRIIPWSFLSAFVVFAGVALWLPGEVASNQAEPEPEPATADARLIAGECAFFVTFRPEDFLRDELAQSLLQNVPKAIEDELHVAGGDIARLTVATTRRGAVQIVRTKKPYDAAKLRKALTQSRFGRTTTTRDKDKGFREAPEPAVAEKKAGGKTIYYAGDGRAGEYERWTTGWCPLDKTTFVMGTVAALQVLLETKGKASGGMSDALVLGPKHSLVMAIDGKRLRTVFRQQREERDREQREWREKRERFPAKDKAAPRDKVADKTIGGTRSLGGPTEIAIRPAPGPRGAASDKAKGDDEDLDLLFGSPSNAIVALPYKPLLGASFGLLTLDVGKVDTLAARIDFEGKEGMADAETALKTLLYVGGQMARILPQHEPEFRGLQPLSDPVRKAFEAARVRREGTTLRTTLTVTPEAGLAKKVRDTVEEESKKRMMYREKDKTTRIREKTTTTDKTFPSDKR